MKTQVSGHRNLFVAARVICALSFFAFGIVATHAGDNENYPGSDYSNFPAASAFVCSNTCAGESKCKAYTFVKPGIQGPSGQCWLKHSTPQKVADGCCYSGRHQSQNKNGVLRKGDMVLAEGKTNRAGSDYRNFDVGAWQECESTCKAEGVCMSWTFVRPGIQGPQGRCWLKNAVALPSQNDGTVSGVKFIPASIKFDD